MKTGNNSDDKNDIPSPYQYGYQKTEITEVYYFSPAKGKTVFLGKTIKKTDDKQEASYILIDPTDSIICPPVENEERVKEIWATIAEVLENRSEELDNLRKKYGEEQDKGKER